MTTRSLLIVMVSWALGSAGCAVFPHPQDPVSKITPAAAPINTSRVDKSPGESAKLCLATAQQLETAGSLPEAAALYENARRSDAKLNAQIARRLGVLYDKQDNFDRARAEYEAILRKQPNDADTLNNLGYGYYSRGNWVLAEQHLRKAVAANPTHKRAWINLGLTLAQMNQEEESLKAFSKVVPPAQAYCNLAFALTTQGRREDAKRAYRRALELDPDLQLAQSALRKLNSPEASSAARAPIRIADSGMRNEAKDNSAIRNPQSEFEKGMSP